MRVRGLLALSVSIALVLGLRADATAQTVNGAIVGVVQDATGGVVPDVALRRHRHVLEQPAPIVEDDAYFDLRLRPRPISLASCERAAA